MMHRCPLWRMWCGTLAMYADAIVMKHIQRIERERKRRAV